MAGNIFCCVVCVMYVSGVFVCLCVINIDVLDLPLSTEQSLSWSNII